MNFSIRFLFGLLFASALLFGGQKSNAEKATIASAYLSSCESTITPGPGDPSNIQELQESFAAHRHNISRHIRIRVRFRGPEIGVRLNLYAPAWQEDAQEFIVDHSLLNAYQQPHYLSQQYAYLFRLTPF